VPVVVIKSFVTVHAVVVSIVVVVHSWVVVVFVLVVCPEVARFPARALSLTESINVTTGGVTTANRPHCCRKARRSLFDHS
jgi:hypothetical protein